MGVAKLVPAEKVASVQNIIESNTPINLETDPLQDVTDLIETQAQSSDSILTNIEEDKKDKEEENNKKNIKLN